MIGVGTSIALQARMKIVTAAVLAVSWVAFAGGSDGAVSEVVYKDGVGVGVRVLALGSASSLAQSGVQPGDVVTRVGHRVATTGDIVAASGVPGPDAVTTTIELVRGDRAQTVQVALAAPSMPLALPRFRIVPAFTQGKCVGMKVFSLSNDSNLSKMGVKNGDIFVRADGIALDSPENFLKAYSAAKETRESKIEVLRGGAPVVLSMNLSLLLGGLAH